MAKPIDITGLRFGRLVVIRLVSNTNRYGLWLCKCDCKNFRTVFISRLRTGRIVSCGCGGDGYYRHGYARHANGKKHHPLYATWGRMRARCNNPNDAAYEYYGGRGISVCSRWDNFANFLADVGKRPRGLSLDRIDNNDDYKPGNVRWATRSQQSRNKRPNRKKLEQFSTAELKAELARRHK